MTTKYDIGENVYLIHYNQVNELKVISITISESLIIEYELEHDIFRTEDLVYKTKEELIKQL